MGAARAALAEADTSLSGSEVLPRLSGLTSRSGPCVRAMSGETHCCYNVPRQGTKQSLPLLLRAQQHASSTEVTVTSTRIHSGEPVSSRGYVEQGRATHRGSGFSPLQKAVPKV